MEPRQLLLVQIGRVAAELFIHCLGQCWKVNTLFLYLMQPELLYPRESVWLILYGDLFSQQEISIQCNSKNDDYEIYFT